MTVFEGVFLGYISAAFACVIARKIYKAIDSVLYIHYAEQFRRKHSQD